jgi:hypothetical protein
MKNNTLTKINIYFWGKIIYFFHCFKKKHHDDDDIIKIHLNDFEKELNEMNAYADFDEKYNLLGVRSIKMNNR